MRKIRKCGTLIGKISSVLDADVSKYADIVKQYGHANLEIDIPDNDRLKTYQLVAKLNFREGNLGRAKLFYSRILLLDPNNEEALDALGEIDKILLPDE